MLIVGFNQYLDFFPSLIVDNLNSQGILATDIKLDLLSLQDHRVVTSMALARLFDDPDFCEEVCIALKPRIGNHSRVGFPAVLGLRRSCEAIQHLESSLGIPIFEIPGLPPSIPGIRIHNMLVSAIEDLHGKIYNGMLASHARVEENFVTAIITEAAARQVVHPASNFVLASGGILGGGVIMDKHGYAQETVFNLPLYMTSKQPNWFNDQFLSPKSHPIHTTGVNIDDELHPVDSFGQIVYQNLFVCGNIIGRCDPIRECSLEGIALASGYHISESIARGRKS
jgi:glycerol-3-phosphate dehydrogenase subunit B